MAQLRRLFSLSFFAAVLAACTSTGVLAPRAATPAQSSPNVTTEVLRSTPVALTKAALESCPVTLPNGKSPPLGSEFNLGNEEGTSFTIPWPEGKVIFARDGPGFISPDGSLEMKWPWWRGVRGKLTIEGRRLDAPAPPLRAEIPEGYGESGFQSTAIIFSSEGCWEITGGVGDARLTFVTLVVRVPWKFININWGPEGVVSKRRDTSDLPKSLRDVYSFATGGELILESTQGVWENAISYPVDARQQVSVNGHPGICVQGAFDEQQQWQSKADAGALEWTDDGSSYRISHKGLELRCEDLLSMARSSP